MKHSSAPPRVLEQLIMLFASSDCRDEIAGDLEEQYNELSGTRHARNAWYCKQTFCSLPYLISLRIRTASITNMAVEGLFVAVSIFVLYLWELLIASLSWPIASRLIERTGVPGIFTCQSVYVFLYAAGVFVAFKIISTWARAVEKPNSYVFFHYVVFSLLATVPGIIYIVQPNPYDDSIMFRMSQILVVWALLLAFKQVRKPNYEARARF